MNTQLELIDSLKSKIVKGNLDALDVAWNQTKDIESFFLADLDRTGRTPAQEAAWLSNAERMLQTWVPYLQQTEEHLRSLVGLGYRSWGEQHLAQHSRRSERHFRKLNKFGGRERAEENAIYYIYNRTLFWEAGVLPLNYLCRPALETAGSFCWHLAHAQRPHHLAP